MAKTDDKYRLLRELSPEQVIKALDFIDGDGHSVMKPGTLVKNCDWPEDTEKAVCRVVSSDLGSPKGTIWGHNGEAIAACVGWYTLEVLSYLARAFDVEVPGMMGRGFQARATTEALRNHFKSKEAVTNDSK